MISWYLYSRGYIGEMYIWIHIGICKQEDKSPGSGPFPPHFQQHLPVLPLTTIPQFFYKMGCSRWSTSILDGFSPVLLAFYGLGAPHC